MFPLSNGRLIRLNKDGSNGEVIQSNKTKMVFGTSIVYDHHIKDVDPANEVSCEISTDEYGRVSITNKTTNEIFVNDKSVIRPSVRPLFNNSIIKICDGVEFRWVYKQAKENIGGDLNDADFASWSDPAKMHMKQSRVSKQRPKGRLTAHPINLYSTAHEDIDENGVPTTESDDERSTGCSVIPTELNDSVFTTQTVDATNVTAPLIDVSQALINLDETQINVPCEKVSEELPTTSNEILVKNEVEMDENLMNFDVPSEQPIECNASDVKSQPSNCSVITLSSDGSQETVTQEINDQNVNLDDEEMFERSISCPPSELPDDLFETSSNEDTENLTSTSNTEGANTTDKTGVNDETFDIKDEVEEKPKAMPCHLSVGIESTQQVSNVNTSIKQFSSNEDDVVIPETQDIIIPETQEVLSQNSDIEMLSTSCSIIDCEKSEYSFDAKDTVLESVKQNISIGQPNMSVVSISSDEGQEVSQVEATNQNSVVLDSENMFETEASNEHQENVEVKAEVPISPAKLREENEREDSTYIEQSNTFNESETMFSQSLNADVNESIIETKPQMEQEIVANITANNLQNSTIEQTQPVKLEKNDSILVPAYSLVSDVNNEESPIATKTETFETENNPVSTSALLETSTNQQESEHVDTEPVPVNEANVSVNQSIVESQMANPTNVSIYAAKTEEMITDENLTEAFELINDENGGIIPIATSSSISVCLSTDTTQELNLLAFNSEFGPLSDDNIEQMEEDTMDRLEFSSSDSMHDSNDSGVTGSCANTSSINVSSEANQTGSASIKSADVSISEIEVARTPSKENSTESPATDSSEVETVPSNELKTTNIELEQAPDNINTVGQEEKTENVEVVSTPMKEMDTVKENIDENVTPTDYNADVATSSTLANVQLADECESFKTETSESRCTPRKLTVSLVQNTPSKIETTSSSMEAQNETAAIAEDRIPENVESISPDVEMKTHQCENVELESPQNNDDILAFSTPAKIVVKSDENCGSVTRSTRRKQPFSNVEIATPKRTPRKLDASSVMTTPAKVDVHEEQPVQDEESIPDVNASVLTEEEEAIERLLKTVESNVDVVSTPVKMESDNKAEQCESTSTRSTRRIQPILEIATPKRTPRKLNISHATPSKSETQSSTEFHNEGIFGEKQIEENVEIVQSIEKEEPMQTDEEPLSTPSVEVTVNDEEIKDQNEDIITETPEQIGDMTADSVATCSTPVQNITKSDGSRALTIPRATRRKPLVADIGLVTPKRTPRKVNVSLALTTETSSTHTEKHLDAQEEECEEKSESAISDEPVENKCIETDQQEDAVFATPAKVPLAAKGNSTIKRSARRKQENVDTETMTPKHTPRKLNVSYISETLCEAEASIISEKNQSMIEESIEPIQNHDDTAVLSTPAKVELATNLDESSSLALTRSTRRKQNPITESATPKQTPQKLDIRIAPKQTPQKLDIRLVTATPCKMETPEETPAQESVESMSVENESIPTDQDKPSEEANVQVEVELPQIQNDIFVATPAKIESTKRFDETSTSSITRSSKRKQNPVIEFATPKQTPRKLDVSLPATTPIKPEEQSLAESNQTEDILEENHIEENVEIVQSIEKVEPMQTDEEALSTPAVEVTVNAEAINDQNEDIITETPEQIGDMTADSVATCSTPVQNMTKSDESRALTVPRAARSKPLVADIGSVTPKRTPRKVNVSLALTTETPSTHTEKPLDTQEEACEEKSESPISDEPVENKCIETDQQVDAVFATPAKVPLAAKGNSTVKRSARRKQENVDSETMTPKRTPRKLNISYVSETPCEVETSIVNEQNQSAIVIDKQTEENIDLITIQSNEEPKESIQSHDDIAVLSTPARVELVTNLDGSSSSALTRSTRRKQNLVTESATPKQTPQKLDISLATATPCKMGTSEETPAQESVESMSVENESIPTDQDKPSEEANVQVEVELPQIQNDIFVATPAKIESTKRFDETSTSSITRSSKRKPNPVIEFATPKQTPRKLDVSLPAATPIKPEEQSLAESNQTEDILEENHIEENVEIVQYIEKVEPMQTDEEALSTPAVEVTVNAEAIKDQNKDIITETPEQIGDMTVDSVATFSTPIQSVKKSDESRALTIPRTARRKPLVADIVLVTPKRTPRKMNVSLALTTETPSTHTEKPLDAQEEACEEKSESPISDEPVENKCIETDQQEDAIFATPAKVPLAAKGNSTVKRSARRKQENVDSETMTPKRTPRKLNISYVPETLCEVETSIVSEQNQSAIVDSIPIQSESNEKPNELKFVIQCPDDIAVLSTPAKVELATNLNESSSSALTRSTRRKQNLITESATPKQTPQKLDIRIAPKQTPQKLDIRLVTATPCKMETPEETPAQESVESMSVENESIPTDQDKTREEANIQVELPQNNIVVATPVKVDLVTMFGDNSTSSAIRTSRRKKQIESNVATPTHKQSDINLDPEMPCESKIVASIEKEPTESETVDENEAQQDSEVSSTINENQTENIIIEKTQSEDIVNVTTPAKPEMMTKLTEECNSAIVQSSKRKRTDLNIGTPIAKRTPRKLIQDTPLKTETTEGVKDTSETVQKEPENDQIQENLIEQVPEIVESVPVENKPKSVGEKSSDEAYERIDAELALIHDDAVPAKISASARSTRNSKAARSTRRKENVDRDAAVQTPNSFNCIVKVTPLKAEVLKAHKSTRAKVTPVQIQVETAEKDAVEPTPKKANDITDIATPSTSKTLPKKRVIRKRTTSKSEPVIEQSKNKDAVSDLVAAVLEENLNENAITSSLDVSGKRAGTPLPASKKRTGRLTGPKAKLAIESNDKPNKIDAEKSSAVDANKKNEETKPENDGGEVIEKSKSSRRKKVEDVVPKQTEKEKKAAGSSGTPLNKRNRNLAVEPSEEIAPSTSEPTKNTNENESKNVKEKSVKATVKSTRRKRASTESDPVENTPKKLKTQLDHVNSAAVATPLSLRSLRNRVILTDENSSVATPKRTKYQRKTQNDDKKDDKIEIVVPKDKKEEMEKEVPVETEKPKRQPRRRLPRTVSVDEPIGSITGTSEEKNESVKKTEESTEDKKPKPATKRSRAKSKAPAEETKSNDDDEVLVKPPAKRGRKNSQAQAKPAVVEESSEQPAETKTKRGRPKRVVIAESSGAGESAVPEPAPKKRAARGRTVSKSEENINKASTNEVAKDETKEDEKVLKKESTKTRGKRTHKSNTEVIEIVQEKQSSPKRSRNTKKPKEVVPEVELIAKEVVIEKKTRKTKKVVESKDTEASTSTPPISTRTRRHK